MSQGDWITYCGKYGGRVHYDMKCPACGHNGVTPPCGNCNWDGNVTEVVKLRRLARKFNETLATTLYA